MIVEDVSNQLRRKFDLYVDIPQWPRILKFYPVGSSCPLMLVADSFDKLAVADSMQHASLAATCLNGWSLWPINCDFLAGRHRSAYQYRNRAAGL